MMQDVHVQLNPGVLW